MKIKVKVSHFAHDHALELLVMAVLGVVAWILLTWMVWCQ